MKFKKNKKKLFRKKSKNSLQTCAEHLWCVLNLSSHDMVLLGNIYLWLFFEWIGGDLDTGSEKKVIRYFESLNLSQLSFQGERFVSVDGLFNIDWFSSWWEDTYLIFFISSTTLLSFLSVYDVLSIYSSNIETNSIYIYLLIWWLSMKKRK